MTQPLLELKDLSIAFRQGGALTEVVTHLSLSLAPGEMLALVGESGCGKSVTALAVMGLLPKPAAAVTGGEIWFEGRNLLALPEAERRRLRGARLSMVFQEPMTALNPVLTIRSQLGEILAHHLGLAGRALEERCRELLSEVGIPEPALRLNDYPHQLSGGMRQRVMLAMALSCQPRLILADEPTTALHVTVQAQIMELINRLRHDHGTAVLFITHNLALASQYADSCAVMYAGELVEQAAMAAIRHQARHPYTRLLLRSMPHNAPPGKALETIPGSVPQPGHWPEGCRFAARCPLAAPECRDRHPGLQCGQDEQAVRCLLADEPIPVAIPTVADDGSSAAAATPLLQVRGLKVWFPIRTGWLRRTTQYVKAVNGIDFTLNAGETLALVGESGCGKSTVAKALVRLNKPMAGEIRLADGTDLAPLKPGQLKPYRHVLQMIFQDPFGSLNPRLTVRESLSEGLSARPHPVADKEAVLASLMSEVGLSADMLGRYPHQFSGGQRQRLGLARALAAEPRIVICDECTSALDVSVQAQILNHLIRLQQQRRLAYLFITHDLGVVKFLADRVAIMYLGTILEEGDTADIFSRPAHRYTQALLAAAPDFDERGERKIRLAGDLPSPVNPPAGCPFHPRCAFATPECRRELPPFQPVSDTHRHRCLNPAR